MRGCMGERLRGAGRRGRSNLLCGYKWRESQLEDLRVNQMEVRVHYGENNVNVGPLQDIPEVCVDHFFASDLRSSAFFLSHAHTDHMVGLESLEFLRRLNDPGVKLYCHTLTPILLGAFSRYLGGQKGVEDLIRRGKLVPLDTDKVYRVEVPRCLENLEVSVTLLPAGHCPGSVMFLFETESLRILHTGDFRVTREDLERMKPLRGEDGRPKRLDHLYVDTTFCTKSASSFPRRKEVIQRAVSHVREWTQACSSNWVYIKFAAKFAHEYILLELSKRFGKLIHVTPERKEIYANIPGLSEVVTLSSHTPFHLCGNRRCMEDGESLELRLTSMWYTMLEESKDVVVRTRKRLNVCYSMHSSLEEIAETIEYLRPSVVTPLVKPYQSSMEEVKEALRERCKVSFTFEDYRSHTWEHLSLLPPPKEIDGLPIFDDPDDVDEAELEGKLSEARRGGSESSGSLPNSQEERLLQMSPAPRQLMPEGLKEFLTKRLGNIPRPSLETKRRKITFDLSSESEGDTTTQSQETGSEKGEELRKEGSDNESDCSQSLLSEGFGLSTK